MNKKNTGVLFILGGTVATEKVWPDYSKMGIDQSDVPELIRLISDESLHQADDKTPEVWVPLHAWRALGQLKAVEAVTPLISQFNEMVEDDWAFSELPIVLGMIGKSAIEPLSSYLKDTRHDEYVRVMAGDGLCQIVKHHPACRDNVLSHYQAYLRQPDISLPGLNGLVIAYLLDLKAKELIDDIREVFGKNCVDISCAGDLEEVEIVLGFRTERSTPKPKFFKSLNKLLSRPDNEDDLLAMLGYYLNRYAHDDSVLDIPELDGFFASLACSPNFIDPSIWLPVIWSGEDISSKWQDKKEIEEFNELIFSFYNHVMGTMNDGEYETLFLYKKFEGKSYLIVDEWCRGFLRGVNLWERLASRDASVVEIALEPIRLFTTEHGFEKREKLSETEIKEQQKLIKPRVDKLFQYFHKQRQPEHMPVVRDSPKQGRNDPCPCGSGKKFKKCCLH